MASAVPPSESSSGQLPSASGSHAGDARDQGASAAALAGASSAAAIGSEGRAGGGGNLAHAPGLLAHGSPCAGFFPSQAASDQGEVQIAVEVDPYGHTRASAVVVEQPYGQGFGNAAKACAARLLFMPAVDASGAIVAGQAKLKLRFRRPA